MRAPAKFAELRSDFCRIPNLGIGIKNGSSARTEIIPDFERLEGLRVGKKPRLDYRHTWQLTVKSFQQQHQSRYLLVFRCERREPRLLLIINSNWELEGDGRSTFAALSRISSTADRCPLVNKTGWHAFEDFAQLLLLYLFDCRFRWMINHNALESSNENSLIVTNVIDTMLKYSASRKHNLLVRTLFLDSFLSA